MTRDDSIKLARGAGFRFADEEDPLLANHAEWQRRLFERFAALVAAAEREVVLDAIDEIMGGEKYTHPMFSEGYDYALGHIKEFLTARNTE